MGCSAGSLLLIVLMDLPILHVLSWNVEHNVISGIFRIKQNDISCMGSNVDKCPPWNYCDTLIGLCRPCARCGHTSERYKRPIGCMDPVHCVVSSISTQHFYCPLIRIAAGQQCSGMCQPPADDNGNYLGTTCQISCGDDRWTVSCAYAKGRSAWNVTTNPAWMDLDASPSSIPSTVLQTGTTIVSIYGQEGLPGDERTDSGYFQPGLEMGRSLAAGLATGLGVILIITLPVACYLHIKKHSYSKHCKRNIDYSPKDLKSCFERSDHLTKPDATKQGLRTGDRSSTSLNLRPTDRPTSSQVSDTNRPENQAEQNTENDQSSRHAEENTDDDQMSQTPSESLISLHSEN